MLVRVLFSVVMAAVSINTLAPHGIAFGRAITAAEELFTLIDRKSEIDAFSDAGKKPEHTHGTIDMKGIGFAYPTRPDVTVLENFTVRFPAGKVTALVVSNCHLYSYSRPPSR